MDNIKLKEGVAITPFMENVIVEVARRHPDWTITSNHVRDASGFRVLLTATQQELGELRMERRYKKGERINVFVADNWRINELRERGSGLRTAKPKDVLRAVEKYFYPLTAREHIDAATVEARKRIYYETGNTRSHVNACISELHQPMLTFTHKHWDMFLGTLDASAKQRALELAEKQQAHNETVQLFSAIDSQNILTVHLTDGKYRVEGNGTPEVYESDALPEDIKTKVGLLKLVEEKQVLPEVGIRVEDVFFIRK